MLVDATATMRRDAQNPRGRESATAPREDVSVLLRDLSLARPSLDAADRQRADALLARPSDPEGDASAGAAVTYLPDTPRTPRMRSCPEDGHFCVHWVESRSDVERISSTEDRDQDGVPDYVQTVQATLEHTWDQEVGALGFRAPLPDDGTKGDGDNPDGRVDVYLADLGARGLYGYCAPDGEPSQRKQPGYCVLDNDFSPMQYGAPVLDSLRVTAAHEFFHAIQFGYDVAADPWFMEGTATWVEDEVHDSINDNYRFLPYSAIRTPRASVDNSIGLHRYGTFVFFEYAAQVLADRGVVRRMWEAAAADSGRYSLQAIRAVVSQRMGWPQFFAMFGAWNTLPAGSYRDRAAYPAPVLTLNRTLSRALPTTGRRSVILPHLASSAIRVAPHSRLGVRKRLLVEVDAPDLARGSAAVLQRRFRNGRVIHSMIRLDGAGNGRALIGFDRRVLSSVVVVVSNTSTAMRDCGTVSDSTGGPIYSCRGRGIHDGGQPFTVRASLR